MDELSHRPKWLSLAAVAAGLILLVSACGDPDQQQDAAAGIAANQENSTTTWNLPYEDWPLVDLNFVAALSPYVVGIKGPNTRVGEEVLVEEGASRAYVLDTRNGSVASTELPSPDGLTAIPMSLSASQRGILATFSLCDQQYAPDMSLCQVRVGAYLLDAENLEWRQLPYPERFQADGEVAATTTPVPGADRTLQLFTHRDAAAYLEYDGDRWVSLGEPPSDAVDQCTTRDAIYTRTQAGLPPEGASGQGAAATPQGIVMVTPSGDAEALPPPIEDQASLDAGLVRLACSRSSLLVTATVRGDAGPQTIVRSWDGTAWSTAQEVGVSNPRAFAQPVSHPAATAVAWNTGGLGDPRTGNSVLQVRPDSGVVEEFAVSPADSEYRLVGDPGSTSIIGLEQRNGQGGETIVTRFNFEG